MTSFSPSRLLVLALALAGAALARPLDATEVEMLAGDRAVLEEQIEYLEEDLGDHPDLERYEAEYRAALEGATPKPLGRRRFAAALKNARTVLLGDEHTSLDSQDDAVRVIGSMASGAGPLHVVLEWVDRRHQATVDAFLTGRMRTQDLRDAVDYDRHWSFPFEGYAKVLEVMRKHQARAHLVEDFEAHLDLTTRDQRITQVVQGIRARDPKARVLVIYGVFHLLGKGHLFDRLSAIGARPELVLVGEAPQAYWSALVRDQDTEVAALQDLGGGKVLLRGGEPNARLFGYREYLRELLGVDEDELEDEFGELSLPVTRFSILHSHLQ